MKKSRIEQDIRAEARHLHQLTLEQIIGSIKPNEVQKNSFIAKKLLSVNNPDAPWVHFANTLGSWEIGVGEVMRHIQADTTTALQLLQVLMGARNDLQLMEMNQKLQQVKDRIPSMVRQITTGLVGGMMAHPQTPALPLPAPAPPDDKPRREFITYDWARIARNPDGPAPQRLAGVYAAADGARIANHFQDAIGVAVSVDEKAYTVKVATNGQLLDDLPPDCLGDLAVGTVLHCSDSPLSGRYLITREELKSLGLPPDAIVKPIARVVRNNAQGAMLLVVDRPLQTLQ